MNLICFTMFYSPVFIEYDVTINPFNYQFVVIITYVKILNAFFVCFADSEREKNP